MCDPLFYSEPTLDIRDSYIAGFDVRPHLRTEEGREPGAVTHLAQARCQFYRNGIPGYEKSHGYDSFIVFLYWLTLVIAEGFCPD